MAEDFAPFNVNVTTDPRTEPSPDTPNAIRVAIGVELTGAGLLGAAPAYCDDPLTHPAYLNPRIANVAYVAFDPLSSVDARVIAIVSHHVV